MATHEPYDFSTARLRATKLTPYLTYHVLSLIPVRSPGLGTFGVDKWMRVYFDPAMFEVWNLDECAAIVLHEDLHVMFRHFERFAKLVGENPTPRQRAIWNIAGDLSINQVLKKAGLSLPKGAVLPDQPPFKLPENLVTEEYYDKLLDMKLDLTRFGFNPDGTFPGECKCWGPAGSGSAADGQPRPWEEGEPNGQNANGMNSYEREMIERVTARKIEEYERQKGRGTVPGDLTRLADGILRPQVNPWMELASACRYAAQATRGHGDFTWRRLNRRMPPGSLRLPAPVKPIPRVVLIVDTSGSMDETDLRLALGVVAQGLRSLPSASVLVVAGDTSARAATKVFQTSQVVLAGGGGTDMDRCIRDVAQDYPRTETILVVTDGYTPWPEESVGIRVIACITRKHNDYPVPDWIKKIILRPEKTDASEE